LVQKALLTFYLTGSRQAMGMVRAQAFIRFRGGDTAGWFGLHGVDQGEDFAVQPPPQGGVAFPHGDAISRRMLFQ
jgi:hypothetical protein